MDSKKFFQSKSFRWLTISLGVVIVALVSFGAGILVGYHKAQFSYAWEENYDHNFGAPQMNPAIARHPGIPQPVSAHGTFGSILTVGTSSLVVNGEEGMEKIVLFSPSTTMRENFNNVEASELRTGDSILVIGAPNDTGQLEAKFIRILP